MATLRVCPGFSSDGNCGRCLKCPRTVLDLMQSGRLDACQILPHALGLARLREVLSLGSGPVHDAAFRKRLAMLETSGGPPGLREVLEEYFAAGGATEPKRRGRLGILRRLSRRVPAPQ